MIEVKGVAAFIDDIMVGIETEEGHNDIVKEVLRRMAENDLFVKLEKCVEDQRGWIFGTCNRTKQSKDREREGLGSSRLTSAEKCQRYAEVFGVGKLLQTVCQGFCKDSKIPS